MARPGLLTLPGASASRADPGFAEDVYGSLKRLRVLAGWIEAERARRGGALSILDFGCGTGTMLTAPLARAGDRVHGVDAHAASIALARERHPLPNLSFGTESLAELRAKDVRYDVVVCSEVLEHTHDPGAHLKGFHGLLARDGLLLVTVPNGYGAFESLQRLDRLLHHVGIGYVFDYAGWVARASYRLLTGRSLPPRPGSPPKPGDVAGYLDLDSVHVQFFRLPELTSLFDAAGFALEATRGRVLLCGPYVDFWSFLSFGGLLFALNNWLADRLPLRCAADWMFRLRRR